MSNHDGTNDNSIYGAFGEFIPQNMTDAEWADHDAFMAQEIDKWDEDHAQEADLYWEMEGDVMAAQYDEPDYF